LYKFYQIIPIVSIAVYAIINTERPRSVNNEDFKLAPKDWKID
jgi:hypothetical protein